MEARSISNVNMKLNAQHEIRQAASAAVVLSGAINFQSQENNF